ncbi:MAG TPA: phosphonate C-P lyase system protein PhnH [Stellaceae bacterium]|nr:phosphonate C-P lyase system protein PhnH [Stellaceae bacterium]
MTGLAAPAAFDFARLGPGFADPVGDAQRCFRAILDAMAHPGAVVTMPGDLPCAPGLSPAATAVALALCDIDTPVWLDAAAAGAAPYLAFHCGAPVAAAPAEARFAFVADAAMLPPLGQFALGTAEFPERSATLVIEVGGLTEGTGPTLRGPGIRGGRRLSVAGLRRRFWEERAALAELFPRGIDLLFVGGAALAAVPRSTQVVE